MLENLDLYIRRRNLKFLDCCLPLVVHNMISVFSKKIHGNIFDSRFGILLYLIKFWGYFIVRKVLGL